MPELCRWCKEPYLFPRTKIGKRRPIDDVCNECADIVQDIIDYNKERGHD